MEPFYVTASAAEVAARPSGPQAYLVVLDMLAEAFCIADVAVQATRPFVDSASEMLVRSREARRRRYARGWLLPDLLVAVPARSLACAAGARLRPLQALKLLRCAHLVVELVQDPHNSGGEGRESTWASRRTARRIAASEEADCKKSAASASQPTAEALASADPSEWLPSVLVNPTLVRVAKQALCFVLSVHVLACGYTALGQHFAADSGDDGDDDAEATADDGADVDAWAFRAVKRIGEPRAALLARWAESFYWALLTTLGNDFVPLNSGEVTFTVGCLLVGIFIEACVVGTITGLISNAGRRAARHNEQLDAVEVSFPSSEDGRAS